MFESQHPKARLDSTDANFIDVIHSNGENLILGGLGMNEKRYQLYAGKTNFDCYQQVHGNQWEMLISILTEDAFNTAAQIYSLGL